jgi:hypothetical protein
VDIFGGISKITREIYRQVGISLECSKKIIAGIAQQKQANIREDIGKYSSIASSVGSAEEYDPLRTSLNGSGILLEKQRCSDKCLGMLSNHLSLDTD